jgi:hypothetical protein
MGFRVYDIVLWIHVYFFIIMGRNIAGNSSECRDLVFKQGIIDQYVRVEGVVLLFLLLGFCVFLIRPRG